MEERPDGRQVGQLHREDVLKAYTRRRLVASVKLGVAAVPFAVVLRLAHGDELVPGTFIVGFVFGFVVGAAELFWLRARLKSLGFIPHLVVKSLAITVIMYLAFVVLNVLDVVLAGITWAQYRAGIFDPATFGSLLEFLERYGVVPEFKAGLHAGEVITAQIGDLKSEIVYNGDVLNTTARIQATCGELGKTLLVSASLVDRLGLGPEYRVERLGALALRGKGEPIELCAVERAA